MAGWRDRSELEGIEEQFRDIHRHFSVQYRSHWCLCLFIFSTHHCVIKPCWKEIIQTLGVNETSIIVKEGPEYQEYKLEGKHKNTTIRIVFHQRFLG